MQPNSLFVLAGAVLATLTLGACNGGGDSASDVNPLAQTQSNTIHITRWEANNGTVLAGSDNITALNIAGSFSLTWTNSGGDPYCYSAEVWLSKDDKPDAGDKQLVGRNCGVGIGSPECTKSSGQLNCSYDSNTNILQCSGDLITDAKVNIKTLLGATATTQPAYLILKTASALALVTGNDYDYKAIKVQFR